MSRLTMRCSSRSEMGRRINNEDAVFASPRLVAVADGVGGSAAGEVASRWAINEMMSLEKRRLTDELDVELRDAVRRANLTLGFLACCRPEFGGMGTTLTAVGLSNDGDYVIANVGDSRTYLYRHGRLRQLTRDQSLVQMLLDRGAITAEQARDHPQRSIVLEALDGNDRPFPEPDRCRAQMCDRLLLCSDGVSDYIDDEQIAVALAERSSDVAAAQLVALALAAGSRDNISAVIADVVPQGDQLAGWLDVLPAPDPPS